MVDAEGSLLDGGSKRPASMRGIFGVEHREGVERCHHVGRVSA